MLSWLTHQALFFFLSYIFFSLFSQIDSAVDVIGTFLPGNDSRPGSTLFVSIFFIKATSYLCSSTVLSLFLL